MTQYIDKSAVIAEIERRIKEIDEIGTYLSQKGVLTNLLCHLNTLEVKEVDTELNSFDATVCKIGSTYLKEMDASAIAKSLESYKDGDKVKVTIKALKG